MAVKKQKSERKVILTISVLILFLLVLGGIRILTNLSSVTIDSRVSDLKDYKEKHDKLNATAWLKVPGTNIDYPVLKDSDEIKYEEDNIQYLWENGDLSKLNKINYVMGHNIMNLSNNPLITEKNHVRFEQLMSFTYLDFAKENEYVQLTIGDKDYLFKIFSVSYPDSFGVNSYNTEYVNTEDVENYINNSLKESIFKYDIDVNKDDTILSLITCTRMFNSSNQRNFKVDARLVRKNEATRNYNVTKTEMYDEVEEQMKGEEKDEAV